MIDIEKLKKNAYDYLASVTDEELLRDLRECGLHLESEQSFIFNKSISMKLDSQEDFLHEPKDAYSALYFQDEADDNTLQHLMDISLKIPDNDGCQYNFSNRDELSVSKTLIQGENHVIVLTDNYKTSSYNPAAA